MVKLTSGFTFGICFWHLISFFMQAIANLSVNSNVAKAVAEEGGISILAGLARSRNRLVAEEAAGGLWNLSVGEEHKVPQFPFFHFVLLFPSIFHWSLSLLLKSYLDIKLELIGVLYVRVLLLRLVE